MHQTRRSFLAATMPASALVGISAVGASQASQKVGGPTTWINVKDFGAIGNGVVDDSVAINSAIQAAVPGDVVYIPKGIYFCGSSIEIKKSIKLFGDFYTGTTLRFGSSINGIVITPPPPGLADITVSNLSLRSQGGSSTRGVMAHWTALQNGLGYLVFENLSVGGFQRGISLEYCQICSIKACRTFQCGIGIYTKRCVNIKIFDSVCETNLGWGLFINGDLEVITDSCGTLISQCQFFNNGGGVGYSPSGNIYVYANENFELVCSMIDVPNVGSTSDLLISSCHRANVSNCWIGASKGSAVDILSSNEIVVSACNIVTATQHGVRVGNSSYCVISACTFRQIGLSEVVVYGENCDANIVSSNTFISTVSTNPAVHEVGARNTVCTGNIGNRYFVLDTGSVNANNLII